MTSYKEILDVFWSLHDPTLRMATQYKSAIWPQTEAQAAVAAEAIEEVEAKLGRGLATRVEQPAEFHPAEWYHQNYNAKNRVRLALFAATLVLSIVPAGSFPFLAEAQQALMALVILSLLPQLIPAFDNLFSILD
mmetsp:Transcript_23426/g.64998  ORF Transcript_23426/g.64998 Transcript_23426/m.64998 type:complete len:135 (-) Transcript_23426:350-754(-)